MIDSRDLLLNQIEGRLGSDGPAEARLLAMLDDVLAHFSCQVGTIHKLENQSGMLHLLAYRGIPEGLLPRVRLIPVGKGMAGLAAERREPVQICNLQADKTGVAKPGAKETGMEGSIAVPMIVEDGVRGVLGIARPTVSEFQQEEIALLERVARFLGKYLNDRA